MQGNMVCLTHKNHPLLHSSSRLPTPSAEVDLEQRYYSKITLMYGLHTRGGIWICNRNSVLAGAILKEAFFGAVVAGASQSCQVEDQWHFLPIVRLRRQVQVQCHFRSNDV